MAAAGVAFRRLLLERAAAVLRVDASTLVVADDEVRSADGHEAVSLARLASLGPITGTVTDRDVPDGRPRRWDGPCLAPTRPPKVAATYTQPYTAHAPVASSCAIAVATGAVLRVWTHAQGIFPLRRELARLPGRPVRFALSAQDVSRPEGSGSELLRAWLRPGGTGPRCGAGASGARNAVPLYDFPDMEAVADHVRGPLRTASCAPPGLLNTFAAESFTDQVAERADARIRCAGQRDRRRHRHPPAPPALHA